MDRRQFFKMGLSGLKDSAKKAAPEIIKTAVGVTPIDVSILTAQPVEAEALASELLRDHFGERMLRLKQSTLEGDYPGGVLLFERNRLRDIHDGISLFYAALLQLAKDLSFPSIQHNPVLIRYVNLTPPMSRSVEVFRGNELELALPLSEDGEFEINGVVGRMHLIVQDGVFRVAESSCTHRTCMAHPPILTPGQRITCVPNAVTAIIGAHLG